MFDSLRSRIFLVIGAVVFLTAVSIAYFAQRHVERTVFKAENRHALDLLNAMVLTVENEYDSLQFHKKEAIRRRKDNLKDVVLLAMSHVDELYQEYLAHDHISEDHAQKVALKNLRQLRYADGVGYFWINDLRDPLPWVLMHPFQPEMENRSLNSPKYYEVLPSGEHLLLAIKRKVEQEGEGFIEYLWNKPVPNGYTRVQPKISYFKLFEPWGWVISSGVYVDDIELEVQQRVEAMLNELRRTVESVRVAENGYMFIFNGQKKALVHPTMEGQELGALINPTAGEPIIEGFMKASKNPDIPYDYLWDHPDYVGEYRFKKRVYVSYFEPLDWYIASTIYLDEISRPGKELRQQIVRIAAGALCVALAIAFFLASSLIRPLTRLTYTAMTLEKEGVDAAEIPVSGALEIRKLGSVMAKLVDSVRTVLTEKEQALDAVERSNADLTQLNQQLAREMSERQQAQTALLANEQKYRTLFQCSYDAIILLDPQTCRFVECNRRSESVFGCERQQLIGKTFDQVSPPLQANGQDSCESVRALVQQAIDSEPQNFDWTHQRCDGSLFQADVSFSPIVVESHPLVLAIVRDITQRKQAEKALIHALSEAENTRDKIDAILKAVSDGLLVIDHRGHILLLNRTAETWLNLNQEDTLNQRVTAILHNSELSQLICSTLTGNSRLRRCELELPIPQTHKKRLVVVQVTAVQGDGENISGALVLLRDITRERELAQMKNDFISTAAHALNTPLTAIMGFAELLVDRDHRQQLSDEQQFEFLQTIYAQGEILTGIVDDLLELQQMEYGQSISIERHLFDLHSDILALVKRFSRENPHHEFITQEIEPCELWADRAKLGQVLDNLLSNAVKFSAVGTEVKVESRTTQEQVVITISDQGVGMDQEQVERVYDKFYRADMSPTSRGGLGMGMTVVKSIVEAHQGKIEVYSQPGIGTTVEVTLPRLSEGVEHV